MSPDCHLVIVVLSIPCLVFCCLAVVMLYAVILTYYHITNQIWTHIGREHGGILSRATRLGWAHVWWPGTAVYAMVTSPTNYMQDMAVYKPHTQSQQCCPSPFSYVIGIGVWLLSQGRVESRVTDYPTTLYLPPLGHDSPLSTSFPIPIHTYWKVAETYVI